MKQTDYKMCSFFKAKSEIGVVRGVPDGYAYDAPKGYSPADNPTFPHNSNKNNYDETVSLFIFIYKSINIYF